MKSNQNSKLFIRFYYYSREFKVQKIQNKNLKNPLSIFKKNFFLYSNISSFQTIVKHFLISNPLLECFENLKRNEYDGTRTIYQKPVECKSLAFFHNAPKLAQYRFIV